MAELDLTWLADLSWAERAAWPAARLWEDGRVVALWLGGSLARGAGDQYSDIDLRVAVRPDDLDAWRALDLNEPLLRAVVGEHQMWLGGDALLRHVALVNGDILDLLVQSSARAPNVEPLLVLGCRDAEFARRLAASDRAPAHRGFLDEQPQAPQGAVSRPGRDAARRGARRAHAAAAAVASPGDRGEPRR